MVRERDKAVTIRMAEGEVEMLKELATSTGLSSSDVVRQLIRREHAKLDKDKKKH